MSMHNYVMDKVCCPLTVVCWPNNMENQDDKRLLIASTIIPLILVALMWLVKIIETVFHLDFSFLGVKPVSTEGIPGIILFHFIHGDWEHLFANTFPMLVLGTSLYYFYRPLANKILLILIFSVGLLTWCGARSGVHIGASGLVYGLTFFLMLSGFIRRNKRLKTCWIYNFRWKTIKTNNGSL